MAVRSCVLVLLIVMTVTGHIHANDELEHEFRKLVYKVTRKQGLSEYTLVEHVKKLKQMNHDIDRFIERHDSAVLRKTKLTGKFDNLENKAHAEREKFDALTKYFPKQVLESIEKPDRNGGNDVMEQNITVDVPDKSVDKGIMVKKDVNIEDKSREIALEIEHDGKISKPLIGEEFRGFLRSVKSKCSFENVAFMASATGEYEHVKANFTVIFDDETLNDGFGYNSETNVFTAPRRGVYMITMNFGWFQEYTAIKLVINGKDTVAAFGGYRLITNGVGGNSVMVDLKRGDKVWVISGDIDNGRIQAADTCCRFTTFSGFLML